MAGVSSNMTYSSIFERTRKAAHDGNMSAQESLGKMYERGLGGAPIDKTEAIKWYQRAADQNYPPGQYALAHLLDDSDPEAAHYWMKKSADQGFPAALYALANVRLHGNDENEIKASLDMLRRSAEGNYGPALIQLSVMYTEEAGHLEKDINVAIDLARKAAEGRSVDDRVWYGMLLLQYGTVPDRKKAMKILKKEAKGGNVSSAGFLSTAYLGGLHGIKRSARLANYYLKLAEKNR